MLKSDNTFRTFIQNLLNHWPFYRICVGFLNSPKSGFFETLLNCLLIKNILNYTKISLWVAVTFQNNSTQTKEIYKYARTSPNWMTQNQIDHICVSRKWRSSLLDVRNRRGADIDSDHELITGDINTRELHPIGSPKTRLITPAWVVNGDAR